MITEKINLTRKIGNFMSSILLGDTKERIVRMDEKLNMLGHLDRRLSVVESDLKDVRERLPAVEKEVGFLRSSMLKFVEKVESLQSGFNFLNGRVETMILSMKNK